MKKWFASAGGALAMAIAAFIADGRKQQPPTAPAPLTAPPSAPAHSILSTSEAECPTAPEIHRPPAEDFVSAIKLTEQNGEKGNDDRRVFELGYRWVAVEPEAALAYVLNMPHDNTLLLVALVDEWTRRDPISAAMWASRLPEGLYRQRVLPSLVATWAESAPTDAVRFARDLPPGNPKDEAIIAAVSGWARQDPPAVLSWVRQFLQGKQQEQANIQAVFAWSQSDPVAAAEWLRSMPDGRTWDSATSVLSGSLVDRYPALALSLATDISDEDLRNQRIENIARRWLDADRASAENALIHSDLPAAFVSRLLR